ncbi:MAG: Calx-beta domain-containing protein [Gammaproteobacteria bacterium]|nr:Calx-beta domain-containing protein [Gammaproteobacteria bacterium]
MSFTEGGSPMLVDAGASVADVDSADFDGGILTVDFTANGTADDRLSIRDQGAGAGNVSLSGSDVRYDFGSGAVLIGSFSGGTSNADPLLVTFNASADVAAVQAVTRNITYQNLGVDPSTLSRDVRFRLSDGDGGGSTPVTATVDLSGDATLVVTTANDTLDGDTSSVDALLADRGTDGEISLREAIAASNANADTNTIEFDITGAGPHTIQLDALLPALVISETLVLDATTQTGFAGSPVIELDGSLTSGLNGLELAADVSEIRGLVINRFDQNGIYITGSGNTIAGNYLGTDANGTSALVGNTQDGIQIDGDNNTIGGPTAADRNIISGNRDEGIDLNPSAEGNVIIGNYIGTDAAGTAAIGNGLGGSAWTGGILLDASNNTIGGTAPGEHNLISGNQRYGVLLSVSATGNLIQGNYIGTDVSGTVDLGNTLYGVFLNHNGAADNTIGGTAAGAGNVIAYNDVGGVGLDPLAGTGNAILGNRIFANTATAIDLELDGVTANDALPGDADSGPNDLQNFPVLSTALTDNTSTIAISGTLNSTAGTTFRIEFFANTSGSAEGQRYLGAATVTTDGSGDASFLESVSAVVAAGEYVTATATVDLGGGNYGDTSEFSGAVLVIDAPLVSITANDGGAAETGSDPGQFTVDLDVPNSTGGPVTVNYNVTGTATAGADYTALSGSVTVADGLQTATIDVAGIADDGLFEANETVVVTLTGTSFPGAAIDLANDTATVAIADNETATANLALTTHGQENGPVNAVFTVTLDRVNNTGADITFDLTAPGGTASEGAGNDYLLPGGAQITVADGAASGSYTLTVLDDALLEGTETVQLQIANPSDADVSIGTATATANIADDDGATVAINDLMVNEAAGNATLTVTLTGNVAGGFSVDYASSDGTANAGADYTAAAGTLNFTGTNGETQTITVTITDEDLVEANETLNVVLSNLSNGAVSFSDATGLVTLTNDDNLPVVTAGQSFNVSELAANGTPVGSVAASDADGGTVFQSWSIVSGNTGGTFGINPATGELTVVNNTSLDFETPPSSYALGIMVSDGTNTSAAQTVAVNVTDVPANAPAGQIFSLSEAAGNGSPTGTVATTGDTAVSFVFTAGNTGSAFAIDSAGNITVNNAIQLDFETNPTYTLGLDVGDGTSTTAQTVTINLTDANDAPTLTGASYSLTPASPMGATVGTVSGSDADTGDTLTYSILAGNTGGTFTIDPASGQITVADSTALTDGAAFNLTVQVEDSGAPALSDTANVSIQVNASPPPVTPPPVQPPPVDPPPTVEPPPLIEPAPEPAPAPDEEEPEQESRSPTGSGTAQPNTPTVATTFLAEETAAVGSGSGDNDLPYGDRDRSRPSLTERAELPVEAPPVQLAQVVAAAEEIKLPEMAQPALWGALDLMTQQMNDAEEWREQERERQVTLQATTGVAFTLSAGFVTWLLRAGTLATSLLSSMPLWRGFDPLPVLGFAVNERKRLKVAAGRLQADEARADPNVERLFDRASQPKNKAPRKARFKGKRRVTAAPST